MDLRGASVALIGRLGRLPRRRLTLVLQELDVTVNRRVSGRTGAMVVAHGAVALLPSGRLAAVLADAEVRGLPILSEHGFLRHLGLMPPLPSEPRNHMLQDLATRAALDMETARLLALFDIIEESEGRYSFRDLKAARDFARTLDHREDLASALETALDARRRHGFQRHLAEVPLAGADPQIPFDLGDQAESFDSLWQSAADAEAGHDYAAADAAYRRCVAMRPRDPVCLFHLADVVAEMDRPDEARDLLSRALAIKPDFAEAWFNLSLLESGPAVKDCLARAVGADPACIEAVHDLALIEMKEGLYDRALPLWERYLALAPKPPMSAAERQEIDRARRALMLCRMARMRPKATPTR